MTPERSFSIRRALVFAIIFAAVSIGLWLLGAMGESTVVFAMYMAMNIPFGWFLTLPMQLAIPVDLSDDPLWVFAAITVGPPAFLQGLFVYVIAYLVRDHWHKRRRMRDQGRREH